MLRRTRTRVLVALVAVTALAIAACGTRVDHDQIVRAVGTGAGPAVTGAMPGAPGSVADIPGATAGPGTTSGPVVGAARGAGPAGQAAGPAGSAGSGVGATGGQRGAASGEPIVVGTVGAYSGPGGAALAQGARALQAWGADVNAHGGINGRPVKVIVMDDGGDASKARSLMKQLVEQYDAVAVVAAMTVVETLNSWRGYVEQKQVPVVGGSCGPEWTQSPVLFRQCPASPEQIYGTAVIGAKYGKSDKFGGLFCSETQSCTFVERELFDKGGAERAGLDPQYRARISVFQADYTAECIQARNAGVELLMVVGDPGTVERVASSCHRQNYDPQYLQISSTMRASAIGKPGLSDILLGMSVFPFAGLSTPAYNEFAGAWQRYGDGSAPGPAAAQGWASGKLFELVATAAGDDISRSSIITELRKLRNERLGGLTTPMTFTTQGPVDARCMFYMHGTGGQWTAPRGDTPECW